MSVTRIILASSSKSRQLLLRRLRLPFEQLAPAVDESPLPDEGAEALTKRLAELKVAAVAARIDQQPAVLIGSDQVAGFQGRIIGKPVDEADAIAGLLAMSGQLVSFYTGLCVMHTGTGKTLSGVEHTEVKFRELDETEVSSYVHMEQPLDAAGGFHSEELGIALFESVSSNDPTSLIGLPLIRLTGFLRELGVPVLATHKTHPSPGAVKK